LKSLEKNVGESGESKKGESGESTMSKLLKSLKAKAKKSPSYYVRALLGAPNVENWLLARG